MLKFLAILAVAARTICAATTNYHLPFAWDAVTNATGYLLVARTNGQLWKEIPSGTNFLIVSNLSPNWESFKFTVKATNALGMSEESAPAVMRWMRVLESDSVNGPWLLLATNQFIPAAPQHFVALSNWNAGKEMRRD